MQHGRPVLSSKQDRRRRTQQLSASLTECGHPTHRAQLHDKHWQATEGADTKELQPNLRLGVHWSGCSCAGNLQTGAHQAQMLHTPQHVMWA